MINIIFRPNLTKRSFIVSTFIIAFRERNTMSELASGFNSEVTNGMKCCLNVK